jgi:hypothetical protein
VKTASADNINDNSNMAVKQQQSRQSSSKSPSSYTAPPLLLEQAAPFSVAQGWQQALAGGLGVLNLFGAFKLGGILATPAMFVGEPIIYAALTKVLTYHSSRNRTKDKQIHIHNEK